MTECKQVLIQPGERRRSTGHKINSQIECTIIRKIQTCLEMFKSFIPPQTDGMICFHSNIGCSESKVIFKWGKKTTTKTKKSLYEEQTFAPCVFHSVSVRNLTERDKQAQAIRDAQKLAQNVFLPWKTNIDGIVSSLYAAISEKFSWSLRKCSDFDLLSFYKGLGRKIFTQFSFRMVLFSVWWR